MGRRRLIAVGLIAVMAIIALGVLREMSGAARQRRHIQRLRDELAATRVAADSCSTALRAEEAAFQRFAQEVDSLREAVRTYESMHPDGVPARDYEAYIDTFDRYNAAVPTWEARADTLRRHWAECRDITELHNLLVDSLRNPAAPPGG